MRELAVGKLFSPGQHAVVVVSGFGLTNGVDQSRVASHNIYE